MTQDLFLFLLELTQSLASLNSSENTLNPVLSLLTLLLLETVL